MKEAEIKKLIAQNEKLTADLAKLQEEKAANEAANPKKKDPPKAELIADTAKEFELVGWVGSYRQSFGKFGIVDLSTLTPEKADRLVKRGFKKIQRISKK